MFGATDSSLGHLYVPVNGSGSTLTACPQKSSRKYLVLFTGTPNLKYSAEISDSVRTIKLNQVETFEAKGTSTVFQFQPTPGISKRQLDVTVESNTDTSAYLKVSHNCESVVNNIRHLDYDKTSIRLTFAKKGRITLSKASSPRLEDSGDMWFIGVALKRNDTSKLKNVTLTLKSSFDYDYGKPFYFLISLSLFGGIFVSLWALLCFRDPYVLVQEDSPVESGSGYSSTSIASSTFQNNLRSLFSSCWKRNERAADELTPLIRGTSYRHPLKWRELFVAMKEVLFGHWFVRGPKTFSYITCIVGFVLMVGAFQFVFEDWRWMIEDGNRDMCFYNDFCYRVSGYDIPFNLMISNLAYMIHGLILAWSVWVMEAELLAWCKRHASNAKTRTRLPEGQVELPNHCLKCPYIEVHLAKMSVPHCRTNPDEATLLHAKAHKRKFNFSLGYSFAWALIFEGCFSTLYHFCPTKLTFQFDTAFMFVIAGLIVLSLYNGLSFKACTADGEMKMPVEATSYFLYFIVPLYVFNYLGSLYYKDTLSSAMEILFIIFLVIYLLLIFLWAARKLFYDVSSLSDLRKCDALTKAAFFILVFVLVAIALPLEFKKNIPEIFLFSCIITSLLAIFGQVGVKFWKSDKTHWSMQKIAYLVFQGLYVLVTLGVMGTAVWIFSAKATSDKTESPQLSRDLNHDCVVVGFFDYHDLWHILSSFALLMGTYLVLYISE